MNERLSLQDLIDLLAKKKEITKKDAETFLRELFAVISENIEANETVKVKDFGTFKLIKVSPRKSVDVNTGEAIEIAAHYKLSFAPDKSLKEAVNRPFAHFESVILEEGVTFDNVEISDVTDEPSEQDAITSKEEIGGIIQEPSAEYSAISENIVEEAAPSDIEIEEDDITTQSESVPEAIINRIEEDAVSENIDKKDILLVVKEEHDETSEEVDEPKRKGVRKRFLTLAFFVFLIIAGFVVGGLYFQEIAEYLTDGPAKKDFIETGKSQSDKPIIATVDTTKSQAVDTVATVKPESVDIPLAKETIKPGHTLRNIALKYYGNKSFWVYIYQENRDKIKNPNNVPLGTELVIPVSVKYGIDAKNSESVKKAKEQEEVLFKQMNIAN